MDHNSCAFPGSERFVATVWKGFQILAVVLGDRLGIRMPKQTYTVLGKPFLVHAATLRKEPDYDDAWLLACANHAELVVRCWVKYWSGCVYYVAFAKN